jgi:hypothetical protein
MFPNRESYFEAKRDRQGRHAEDLLNRGIAAAKAGQRDEARFFLQKATELDPRDARPWVWLSSTTDDPKEQRGYLEYALAADPHNATAKRGLVMLSGKVKPDEMLPLGAKVTPQQTDTPLDAAARTFACPNCGGLMKFNPAVNGMQCERCGNARAVEARNAFGEQSEHVLDFVLPTARAHRWAAAHHLVTCQNCGAGSLLPPAKASTACPFCGSDHLIESAETASLIEPQTIIPMQVDRPEAEHLFGNWLKGGLFTPSDFGLLARTTALRPAYYPFWTFDATYTARWVAEVNLNNDGLGFGGGFGNNQHDRWVMRKGEQIIFANDVLVPGTKQITLDALKQVEPFHLAQMVEFKPEFLAGWPTLTYDSSLADASIEARGRIAADTRETLEDRVLTTEEKRNFQCTGGDFSSITYRHILLPLWVATYTYQGQEYTVLINGQTKRVSGRKPQDNTKVMIAGLIGTVILIVLALLVTWMVIGG